MSAAFNSPAIQPLSHLDIKNPESVSALVPLYVFRDFNTKLCSIDLVFDAGYADHNNPAVPEATGQLLFTATSDKNAEQIADEFDQYGAYTQCHIENTFSRISLFALDKFLPQVFRLFIENFNDQKFHPQELEYFKLRKSQELRIAEQKTAYQAKKKFYEMVLGTSHYAGKFSTPADIDALSVADCEAFFKSFFSLKYIVLTGPFDDTLVNSLKNGLGDLNIWKQGEERKVSNVIVPATEKLVEIPKTDAVQCSLRMGLRTIGFHHPDYIRLQISNALLGGFFGSRLMKNIREDKGYTYGIHSLIYGLEEESVLSITSDLKKSSYKDAINEIFAEVARLKTEAVPADELEMLRSYLQGSLIHRMDQVTSLAGMYISLKEKGTDMNYYQHYFHTLANISGEEINQTIAAYLHQEDFYTVVSGT